MESRRIRMARRAPFVVGALLISLALAAAGWAMYRQQVRAAEAHRFRDLSSIAAMKVEQISAWRRERLADVRLHASGVIRLDVLRWRPEFTDEVWKNRLQVRFGEIRDFQGYQDVLLVAPSGLLLALDPRMTTIEADSLALVKETLPATKAQSGTVFRCSFCEGVHYDVAAPIRDDEGYPVAALLLRSDPARALYPLLQFWPMAEVSGESLLLRVQGEEMVCLSPLRWASDPPLSLRNPVKIRTEHGEPGLGIPKEPFHGVDYLGVPVLAVARAVPETPWVLVVKMDEAEALAEARRNGLAIGMAVLLAMVTTVLGATLLFRNRQRAMEKRLRHAERGVREAHEELRATLYGIGDGVIATDTRARVTRINPMAEDLTGWVEAEAIGRPIEEVFRIVNEQTRMVVENPVHHVLRDGRIVGLANHTVLIARNGAERPITDSGAPIFLESGAMAGVVLVFRDQTAERAAQRALQAAKDNARALMEASPVAVLVIGPDEGIVDANPAAERIFLKQTEAFAGRRCGDFLGCLNRTAHPGGCGRSGKCTECELYAAIRDGLAGGEGVRNRETQVMLSNEAREGMLWVQFSAQPVRLDGTRHVILVLHDITERKHSELRLAEQVEELRRWQAVMLDREDRLRALKREVNAARASAGQPPRYAVDSAGADAPEDGA
jgi:two-component system, cell cycle sensor histidine kinase and response regulator CckA